MFFAIWWPWVNFTWFASAYDTDDVLYRVAAFVQITGVLVASAGIASAFEELDFRTMVVGYVIMRIALVGQWLRVAREDPARRRTALRFAAAIALVQVGWAARLAIPPPFGYVAFAALGVAELLVPVWAESAGRSTPWHPRHVTERYGLFTILVIGECVLAASTAGQEVFNEGGLGTPLLAVAIGGLLLIFGLWWTYFKESAALDDHAPLRSAVAWGYGHYVIFAAVAALGAGLQVAADATLHPVELSPAAVAPTVGVPVAIYLVSIAVLHRRVNVLLAMRSTIGLAAGVILLTAAAATWIGAPLAILVMGLLVAGLVAAHVVASQEASAIGTLDAAVPDGGGETAAS